MGELIVLLFGWTYSFITTFNIIIIGQCRVDALKGRYINNQSHYNLLQIGFDSAIIENEFKPAWGKCIYKAWLKDGGWKSKDVMCRVHWYETLHCKTRCFISNGYALNYYKNDLENMSRNCCNANCKGTWSCKLPKTILTVCLSHLISPKSYQYLTWWMNWTSGYLSLHSTFTPNLKLCSSTNPIWFILFFLPLSLSHLQTRSTT